MAKIWNELELKKPPNMVVPISNAQFVERLRPAIDKYFAADEQNQQLFAQEAALLARLMARRKNSFSKMSGFRILEKLNAAVCRLLRVDLTRDLEQFRGTMPDFVFGDDDSADVPPRNNLDYVLLRIVGVHRIHQRIHECCLDAGEYFARMIRGNLFIEINTLLLAVCSKIYSLSASLGNNCVALYAALMPKRMLFPQTGKNRHISYPKIEQELPAELEGFVDDGKLKEIEAMQDASSRISMQPTTYQYQMAKQRARDIGMAVERGQGSHSQQNKAAAKTFNIEALDNVAAVKMFIVTESEARQRALADAVTKRLSNHEWVTAKRLFERKVVAGQHCNALYLFRKFLSAKI